MYDALRGQYTFACPTRGTASVPLSAFRSVERLPGSTCPAAFSVRFSCPCGGEHPGLVSHDELDWAPLGLGSGVFLNLMTARYDEIAAELGDLAARRIEAGEWPWSFFCYPEGRPRPVFPSSFRLLATAERRRLGLAASCPTCESISVNLVSAAHVDVPFHNDHEVGVLECVLAGDAGRIADEFREELHSATFDARRLALDG
jgi:hypothetical protein